MKPIWRLLLVGVVLALLLSACSSVNYNLYGTWADAKNGTVFEFQHSGHFRYGSQGRVVDFPFTFKEPGVFTYTAPDQNGVMGEQTQKYTLQGDTLTLLTDSDSIVLQRVK